MTKTRFAAVFEYGESRRFPLITLRWSEGSGDLAFAVTKKAGTKPRRNRIKRRLVEAFRAAERNLAERNPVALAGRRRERDVIVSAGLRCLDAPFADLVSALTSALNEVLPQ